MPTALCKINGCDLATNCGGMCKKHYDADYRRRNLEIIKARKARYYLENAKDINTRRRNCSEEERLTSRLRDRRYYNNNTEKRKGYQKAYNTRNADLVRQKARENYQQNRERRLQQKQQYYTSNKDILLRKQQEYGNTHTAAIKQYRSEYVKLNRKRLNYVNALRHASKLQATPKWLTKEQKLEIRNIYESCPDGYHVDHIIPLKGKEVRGLHVPWNLRHLPAAENLKKSNRLL